MPSVSTAAAYLYDITATVNTDLFGFTNTAANAINNANVQSYTHTFHVAFSASIIEILRCIVGNKVFALERG